MKIGGTGSYREPDILTSHETDSIIMKWGLESTTRVEWENQLNKKIREMIQAIEKYGGFYIGRYETGGLSTKAVVVKGNNDMGGQNWYTQYKRCKELKGNNTNIETSMLWGCQFDKVHKFLVDTGNKSLEDIAVDSSRLGKLR